MPIPSDETRDVPERFVPLTPITARLGTWVLHGSAKGVDAQRVGALTIGCDRGYIALDLSLPGGPVARALLQEGEVRPLVDALIMALRLMKLPDLEQRLREEVPHA